MSARVRMQLRSALRALVFMLVAALLLLAGLIFLMLGAYQTLALHMPSWQAGGVVALAALVVCLVLVALAGRGGRRARPAPSAAVAAEELRAEQVRAESAAELGAAAGDFVRSHRPTGLELTLGAFVAGMLASRRSRRRPPP